MLSPFEQPFLKELQAAGMLSDCPVDPELSMIMGAPPADALRARLARWCPKKDRDSARVAAKAYQAFLGYALPCQLGCLSVSYPHVRLDTFHSSFVIA